MSTKQNKHRREIAVTLSCPCGNKHRLIFGLGELQVLSRAICKNKPVNIYKPRHQIFVPSRRNGELVYQLYDPQKSDGGQKKEVS